MRTSPWIWLPAVAVCTSAQATTYLSVEQAQQAIFPGSQFTEAFVTLTDAQRQQVERMTGASVPHRPVRAWRVTGGGTFIVDEAVGKHEAITYAVGINADGSVRQVEILDYRESYGWEIRNPAWRHQFVGKTAADPVRLDKDIRNISGATLSCRHVTEGVQRLLATYAVALR